MKTAFVRLAWLPLLAGQLALAQNAPPEAAPATAVPSPAATAGKIIRIKAGQSTPFKDAAGNEWEAERGFEGGNTIDRDPDLAIANTKDPGLYRSEHYSMDSFSCDVPNGKYVAKLYFAETFDGITRRGATRILVQSAGKGVQRFRHLEESGRAEPRVHRDRPGGSHRRQIQDHFHRQHRKPGDQRD